MSKKKDYSITPKFGPPLAEILSRKIEAVYPHFKSQDYIRSIAEKCEGLSYTQRVELHARVLKEVLPGYFKEDLKVLMQILGDENPKETGMFTNYYWLLPIGKYVELYGLEHYKASIEAIGEITKRNTGEYAIRPFIRKYPDKILVQMKAWAKSPNFHLRRLASEGLRPKLPWAPKLDTFIKSPEPVFEILELLKEDPIKFVQKSVANHITDYLKVNTDPTLKLLSRWKKTDNVHTLWIVKYATRKFDYRF